jgi:hypothetical protein
LRRWLRKHRCARRAGDEGSNEKTIQLVSNWHKLAPLK